MSRWKLKTPDLEMSFTHVSALSHSGVRRQRCGVRFAFTEPISAAVTLHIVYFCVSRKVCLSASAQVVSARAQDRALKAHVWDLEQQVARHISTRSACITLRACCVPRAVCSAAVPLLNRLPVCPVLWVLNLFCIGAAILPYV